MTNSGEKENIFLRIVKYLIPWKGDKFSEVLRKIVFIAAAVVLVVSVYLLAQGAFTRVDDNKQNEEIAEIFHGIKEGSATVNIDQKHREEIEKQHPQVMEEFLPLLDINKDVIGWITIKDADGYKLIDYPVMQCDNNDYYLDHDFKGNESKSGAIYADYRVPITAESGPANTILFGHNMASGEYFAMLTRYFTYRNKDSELNFYKRFPTVEFSTLYKTSTYKIFAGMLVNVDEKDGEVFKYLQHPVFRTKADFDGYLAAIYDRTVFYSPDVGVKYGDQLLTLSTCIFGYGADARWVVFAREVREDEKESDTVDTSKAYENPDPLYFDTYYTTFGGSWGGRKWPKEYIDR